MRRRRERNATCCEKGIRLIQTASASAADLALICGTGLVSGLPSVCSTVAHLLTAHFKSPSFFTRGIM